MTEAIETNPDEHNGWTNRETWATALHLSNDQGLYNKCRELVQGENRFSGSDAISKWVMEEVNTVFYPDRGVETAEWLRLLAADVGSFWRVDWMAVADSFIEE
jgi:hypothetical protein